MGEQIQYIRLVGNERRIGPTLASVSRTWQGKRECFMFISPHDDDAVIGAGIFMQLAMMESVPVHIVIITDGSQGYCSEQEKNSIGEIRRAETFECYQSLGVPRENIIWLGFPDCRLSLFCGRRPAKAGEPAAAGFTGLQNAITKTLRDIRPTQVFMPTSSDLHPDHKIVHQETLISLFHAAGAIWPELGKAIDKVPWVHEMGVYCDFPEPPKLRICATQQHLENKLRAIGKFKSQKQIDSLIEIVRKSGPQEYLRELQFKLYQPRKYHDMFEEKDEMPFGRWGTEFTG